MSYQPHLHKGGELYHFRTKGSKNGVSNTPGYKAVGKKALGFLNSAGQYVYNNASKVAGAAKEFVTGNKAKAQFNKADWRARNTGSTTIGQGYKNSRETQERIGMARYTNARRADAASKAYGKTLPGIAQNTKAAIKTTGKNVGNWLNNRAGDAKKAGNAIGEAASSAYKNAREFITGENAKKELDRTTKGFSGLVTGKSGKKKAKEQYGKTLPGMIDNAKKSINDIVSDPKKAADNARKSAGNWLNERGNDIAKAAGSAKKAAGDLAKQAGKVAADTASSAREKAGRLIDDAAKASSKGMKDLSKRAKDFVDYKITGEGQKRDRAKAEEERRTAIDSAEKKLSTVKTASEREQGLRDLIKAHDMGPDKGMKNGNWNRGDTKAGHFLERIKNNLTKIDRLESDIGKGFYKGKELDRAKKELAEARIDNELSVGQFYGNKNASGKWGPMYEYENGQKQLNKKNINPDNKPDNVSQQEWDRYVAENYGHYPNRGRHDKKNNLNDLYNTDKHGYSHKSELDYERTREQINRTIAKQNKNFAKVETVPGNSKSSSKSSNSAKSEPTQSSNNESIIKDEDYNKRHPKQRHHLNMNYKYR